MPEDSVVAACAPWRHGLGAPPPEGSPLLGVFEAGMRYAEHLLASRLGVEEYEPGKTGHGRDVEAVGSMENILSAAGLEPRPPGTEDDGWPG